jgi:hypothetical protein
MTPADACDQIRTMLIAGGFKFEVPDPSVGWAVFKRFAKIPVEGADDGLLWQVGCYDFTGRKLCYLDFVRQFSFSENDEYDHMEQLHLKFTCPPTPSLAPLERNLWAFDYPSLEAYFSAVESFPEFQTALEVPQWNVELSQERV